MILHVDKETVFRKGVGQQANGTPMAGKPFLLWWFCELGDGYVMFTDNQRLARLEGGRPVFTMTDVFPVYRDLPCPPSPRGLPVSTGRPD